MSLKWDGLQNAEYFDNITTLSLQQKSVIVTYSADSVDHVLYIHYNNGLTIYNKHIGRIINEFQKTIQ